VEQGRLGCAAGWRFACRGELFRAWQDYRKRLTMVIMAAERITLPTKVREYFANIGRRGGGAGRHELTRRQARLMVAIREAKRVARKDGNPPLKLSRHHRAILRQGP
jgi:hypothetical protein